MKRERTDQQIILAVVDAACKCRDRIDDEKPCRASVFYAAVDQLKASVDDYRQRIRERDGELMEARIG